MVAKEKLEKVKNKTINDPYISEHVAIKSNYIFVKKNKNKTHRKCPLCNINKHMLLF